MNTLTAQNLAEPIRADLFLLGQMPTLTRSAAKEIVMKGYVKVNGESVWSNFKIHNGAKVEIDSQGIQTLIEELNLRVLNPVKMDLDILFEDENLLAVNKPTGVVVHPVYAHTSNTLLDGVLNYFMQKKEKSRPRPLHRLDKETSGVILFSKNKAAHEYYSNEFAKHTIQKSYLAIVPGDFSKILNGRSKIDVQSFIGRSEEDRRVSQNTSEQKGLKAKTIFYFQNYTSLKNLTGKFSIVKAVPVTGRTHQIRVHLCELGFPIVGDRIYNGANYKRLMLHASEIMVMEFKTRKELRISAKDKDFDSLLSI